MVTNNKRNFDLEERFKRYLFRGDADRFKKIAKNVGFLANIRMFK